MRRLNWIALVPLAFAAAACRKDNAAADALKADLSLAAQAQPYAAQPISPTEAGLASQQLAATAPRTTTHIVSAPGHLSSTLHRSSGASRSSSRGSGTYYPAPAPKPGVVKHTQRDAAIGAAAGAVRGATTSRNKIKGGIIGAAVGGILGGVIGNNVDKSTRPWATP